MLESLFQDVRYALRTLMKSPGFSAVAVITLALGIGANAAIFSVVNGVLLRPLPLSEPDRVVTLGERNPKVSDRPVGASFLNFMDWSDRGQVFEQVAAYRVRRLTLTGRGDPRRISGIGATSTLFPLLRVTPAIGRTFGADDEKGEQSSVVLISHALWQRVFAGDRNAIGQALVLENVPRTVIGVLPADFWFVQDVDIITPLDVPSQLRAVRGARFLQVLARVRPNVSMARAQADVDRVAAALADEHANFNKGWGVALVPLGTTIVGGVRKGLLILLGTVALVLLIACANVANLLLSRGLARQREVALRIALGATRARVHRLLMVESLMLSAVSAGVAIVIALWSTDALRALTSLDLPRADAITVDGTVLAFTSAVALVTAVLFGAAPALQAAHIDLQESLKKPVAGVTRRHVRIRALLVVCEISLSVIVLVGAGLLARSFIRLLSVNPGFRTEGVLTFDLRLPQGRYPETFHQRNFFNALVEQGAAVPGVRSIAVTSALPLSGNSSRQSFTIAGRTSHDAEWASFAVVSPGYWRVMGIPLLRGRDFAATDGERAPQVAIVNESMARKYWPAGDAVGKRILYGGSGPDAGPTVVGVVGDVRQTALAAEAEPEYYLPFAQQPLSSVTVVVLAADDVLGLIEPFRALVTRLDANLPVERMQPIDALVAHSVSEPRIVAQLMGIFSVLALALVAVGIYGVVSYSVVQRTHEIGIRMAIGADRGDILRVVVAQSLVPAGIGVALGSGGALAMGRLIAARLFDVRPSDPITFGAVAMLLIGVTLAASYVPARRAASVHPMRALRHD